MELIVIGLDGACLEIIDPWIEKGELPNLAKLKREGVWGDMASCLPPTTSPNWKCYSTGKNPAKLGIFWWENIDFKRKRIYFPRERVHQSKEIWDYLGEAGRKVGVIDMPLSYPPRPVKGFLISGSADAEEHGFAYPADLEAYLRDNYAYRVHPQLLPVMAASPDNIVERQAAISEIINIIENRFKVAEALLAREQPDFMHLTIFYINELQHYFWNAECTKKAWQVIDKGIGELAGQVDNVLIMSDHGCNEIRESFNINTWLYKDGYLKLNSSISDLLYKLGINLDRMVRLAHALHIAGIAQRLIPKRWLGFIPNQEGIISGGALVVGDAKTRKVDWDRSKALASGQGPVYLNPNLGCEEYEDLRRELTEKLQNLNSSLTGERVISRVLKKEELYSGEYLPEMPDLFLDQAKGVHINGDIGGKEVFELPRRWKGENKRTGLFMAGGRDIKQGARVDGVSILDLAPTILHMMGQPVPQDMDGRVLSDIFKPGSPLAERKVEYQRIDRAEAEKLRIRRALSRLAFRS